uniref:RNA-polymerase II-associated protein 3-like C-terminal domain-containing protein n=1 Tax=Timema douglasi TaxID=61478 RepID=A0A7R8ZDK3_TIMDO|nr:unnamed protein product [Timema douglasi]
MSPSGHQSNLGRLSQFFTRRGLDRMGFTIVGPSCGSLVVQWGEVGSYPDLLDHAEARLSQIMPESRVLRVERPILTKSSLLKDQLDKINTDLQDWTKSMKNLENDLKGGNTECMKCPGVRKNGNQIIVSIVHGARWFFRNRDLSTHRGDLASDQERTLRLTKEIKTKPANEYQAKIKSHSSVDYTSWDKFDVEKELKRIDIEEEKKNEETIKKKRLKEKEIRFKKEKKNALPKLEGSTDYLSSLEKIHHANQFKAKGNEFFNTKEYDKALEQYTASISILPTVTCYNNRAITFLKLKRYSDVIADCNYVLEQDADNMKGYFRRGVAYQHKNLFLNARDDFARVLQLDPNFKPAQILYKQMKEKVSQRQKGFRLPISEEDDVVNKSEPYSAFSFNKPRRRLNEFGLARNMGSTAALLTWVRRTPPPCQGCSEEGRDCQRELYPDTDTREKDAVEDRMDVEEMRDRLHLEEGGDKDTSLARGEPQTRREQDNKECLLEMAAGDSVSSDGSEGIDGSDGSAGSDGSGGNIVATTDMSRLQDSVTSPSSPYEFLKVWESLEDPNLMSHARLLWGLKPSDLTIVLGNKLDGNMLRTILACLRQHFLTRREDGQLALQYLQALSQAERFSVVIMFLTDKEVIQDLFGRLESLGLEPSQDLKNVFNHN